MTRTDDGRRRARPPGSPRRWCRSSCAACPAPATPPGRGSCGSPTSSATSPTSGPASCASPGRGCSGVVFELQQPFHGDLVERLYAAAAAARVRHRAVSAVAPTRDEPTAVRGAAARAVRGGDPARQPVHRRRARRAGRAACPPCWSPAHGRVRRRRRCGATTWSASAWPSTTSSSSGTGASRTSTAPTRPAAPTGAGRFRRRDGPPRVGLATPTSSPVASPRPRAPAPCARCSPGPTRRAR